MSKCVIVFENSQAYGDSTQVVILNKKEDHKNLFDKIKKIEKEIDRRYDIDCEDLEDNCPPLEYKGKTITWNLYTNIHILDKLIEL